MLEKEIEAAVCKYARDKYNCLTYKFTSPQRRNVPDRIIIYPRGRIIFIEFKAPGKKPTSGQEREINRLLIAAQIVDVCDDVDLGKRIIDAYAI